MHARSFAGPAWALRVRRVAVAPPADVTHSSGTRRTMTALAVWIRSLMHTIRSTATRQVCFQEPLGTSQRLYRPRQGCPEQRQVKHRYSLPCVRLAAATKIWWCYGPQGNKFSSTNIWGKKLSNGSFALLFINVGPKEVPSLTCGPDCVAKLLLGQNNTAPEASTPALRYRVRDIWAKRDLPDQLAPLTIRSPPLEAGTGVHMVRLWPSD